MVEIDVMRATKKSEGMLLLRIFNFRLPVFNAYSRISFLVMLPFLVFI